MGRFAKRLDEALDPGFRPGDVIVNKEPVIVYSWDLRTSRLMSYKPLHFRPGLTFTVRGAKQYRDHEGQTTYVMFIGETAVPLGGGRFGMTGTYKWESTDNPSEYFVRSEEYVRPS